MKKFIILLVVMILSIPVFSQDSTKVDPNLKYVTEKLGSGISVLSEKLKAPAEHVYQLLVTQARIEGIVYIVFFVIMLVLFIILLPKAIYWTNDGDNDIKEATYTIWTVIVGIFLVAGTILALKCGIQAFNPEYYAIEKILEVFK